MSLISIISFFNVVQLFRSYFPNFLSGNFINNSIFNISII